MKCIGNRSWSRSGFTLTQGGRGGDEGQAESQGLRLKVLDDALKCFGQRVSDHTHARVDHLKGIWSLLQSDSCLDDVQEPINVRTATVPAKSVAMPAPQSIQSPIKIESDWVSWP